MTSELVNGLFVNRRSAMAALAATGAGLMTIGKPARAATGKPLDFNNPYDNLYAFGKIWGGYDEPVLSGFHGLMYARIGAKRAMPLFGYTGTGVMQSKIDSDGNCWIRGKETGFFTDLATGDILDTWKNPFTGETVKVFNFYNRNMGGKLTAEVKKYVSRFSIDFIVMGSHGAGGKNEYFGMIRLVSLGRSPADASSSVAPIGANWGQPAFP